MAEPARVFVLSGRKSQEIPPGWYATRRGEEPELVRECCVEVAPGVLVRLLGHGDFLLPDGGVASGAQIAVWAESFKQETVTEYGFQMSGGGWQTMNIEDYILKIYPLAKQIEHRQRFGGSVYRRRVAVLEDWKRLRKGAKS